MAMGKGLGSGKSDECGVQVMQGLNYQFGSLDLRGFPKHVGILILDNLFFFGLSDTRNLWAPPVCQGLHSSDSHTRLISRALGATAMMGRVGLPSGPALLDAARLHLATGPCGC